MTEVSANILLNCQVSSNVFQNRSFLNIFPQFLKSFQRRNENENCEKNPKKFLPNYITYFVKVSVSIYLMQQLVV